MRGNHLDYVGTGDLCVSRLKQFGSLPMCGLNGKQGSVAKSQSDQPSQWLWWRF